MRRYATCFLAALCLLLTSSLSFAQVSSGRYLPADQVTDGRISLADGLHTSTYQFVVRDSVFSLTIELSGSQADLDLFLYDGRGDLVTYSELTDYNESLFISRMTDPGLQPGRYTVEVTYPFDRPPAVDGRELTSIPYRIIADTTQLEPVTTLVPGRAVTGQLLPENGMTALYEIEVSPRTEALRIDISDTDADVDLFLYYDSIPMDLYDADHLAQTLRSTESVVISSDSVPPLRAGTYQLLVLDQVTLEQEASFRLSVTDGRRAPARLRSLPELPTGLSGLEKALLATVEVLSGSGSGGSGTLVSAAGHILTNWHVVAGPDGTPDSDITIGLSLDHARPPVELFQAEVIEYAEDRDLALLQITGTRYGDDTRGIRLPHLEIRTNPVTIAEELQFIGYPGVGGTGSRASITYTRGVVSGFQQTVYGYDIKTDGEINSGNSGGAALDGNLRLVGVPSSVVGEDAGQIAYVVPVAAVPAEWFEHLD